MLAAFQEYPQIILLVICLIAAGALIVWLVLRLRKRPQRIVPEEKQEETLPPATEAEQPEAPVINERDLRFIQQVTQAVEEHIDDPMLDVEKLTTYTNTSRTFLYTKFKELLDTTPAAFITEIRLKRAVQLLESRQFRVNEVAAMCGFNNPKYFTRFFKHRMGVAPGKYHFQNTNSVIFKEKYCQK